MKNWWAGVVVLLAGCSLQTGEVTEETGEAGGGKEVVSSTAEPLLGGWATGPFTWSAGQAPTLLEATETHVCVLTRMSGLFGTWDDQVKVTTTEDGSHWILTGFSPSTGGVSGEATCFPLDGFTSNSDTHFASGEFESKLFSRGDAASNAKGGGCQVGQRVTALGSDFAFLEGVEGGFSDSGSVASIDQAPSAGTWSVLRTQVCAATFIHGFSRFLRVSKEASIPTQFIDAKSNYGDFNAIPEFKLINRSADVVRMAPSSRGMCAFTKISGTFRGEGEVIQIRQEGGYWVLRMVQGSAYRTMVGVNARCFARRQ